MKVACNGNKDEESVSLCVTNVKFNICIANLQKNGDQLLTREKGPPDNEHPAMGFY